MEQRAKTYKADVVIAGGGLAGIVTAFELLDRGRRVIILERDVQEKFGGLAKDSFGGIMMIDTPLQRKSGIRDNPELALADWHSFASFGDEDDWPRKWAETYVYRSDELIYRWLDQRKVTFLPVVNWTERGLFKPGNSVPRWHIAWGTGHVMIEAILKDLKAHPARKNLTIHFSHRVDRIISENGRVTGVSGIHEQNGEPFSAMGDAVVISSGGICGGDLSMVRENWYKKWGEAPRVLLNGSHAYADGLVHKSVEKIGGNLTHLDKQWHYAAGIRYPGFERENKGLSLVPPRSALWVNATGERIMAPTPLMGYTDTRHLVKTICGQPGQYSWQIMNWKIAIKELAVSGSEHMKAFRHQKRLKLVKEVLFGNKELVNRLIRESEDFLVADSLDELIDKMNRMDNEYTVDGETLKEAVRNYDARIDRGPALFNDDQLRRIANFRTYKGDRLRTCRFQKIDDPKARPLIAVREFILSRKSLGGIQTNLECAVLNRQGDKIPGLYATGEAAGFGGGGIHGKGSLEGTFLGSCILTGRIAGQQIAKVI